MSIIIYETVKRTVNVDLVTFSFITYHMAVHPGLRISLDMSDAVLVNTVLGKVWSNSILFSYHVSSIDTLYVGLTLCILSAFSHVVHNS